MTINDLIIQLRHVPNTIEFSAVMQVMSEYYAYSPSDFANGPLHNAAGSNEGSCKIFFFAQLHQLTESETLHLFGSYYRDDVLANPTRNDHGNIRHFMLTGWAGIKFGKAVLELIDKQ